MKYSIGLDCGISSVGFAVMELDSNDEPCRIINLGSRIFDKAENPKDGSSLALPRREARGTRRRIRRHQHRLERIRYLLVESNVLTQIELDELFCGNLQDIYQLRTEALDRKVSNKELARILINLAQRRGFKSNRKSEALDKEAGKLLNAVENNQQILIENNYRTVGEMFYKDKKFSQFKRNKAESYNNTVSRSMVESEIHQIFSAQRELGNIVTTEDLEEKYTEIVLSQRPFDLGPGKGNKNSPSKYSGSQIEKMVGKCTLIKGEQRAAKATYSFQLFTLWQNINNIKIVSSNGEKVKLTDEERKKIFDLCHKSPSVTYEKIRKELSLSADCVFVGLPYGDKSIEEVEKKRKFEYLKAYHQIRKALDKMKKGYISSLSVEELDAIGEAFSFHRDDSNVVEYLRSKNVREEIYDCLLENISGFAKFGHISVKACKMLLPYLEKGMTYDKACDAAGLDFKSHVSEKSLYLKSNSEELEDIKNPVVRRAVSQTVKVVNSIIRSQGHSPVYINIELARDLSKTLQERKKIESRMKENREKNEKIVELLKSDFNINYPTGMDIVKLKLWREQDGICPYTQKSIAYDKLFDNGYTDVDHIIPYSICFDDSYNNKVLTFSSENRQKRNRLPLEYLHGQSAEKFKVWVNSSVKNFKKKQNLLKESFTEEDRKEFKTRNLNDTKYLSRVLYNYINDTLLFEEYKGGRSRHVTAVNGAVTSYMRKRWGIEKIRENGDLHHAVDACVIACITQGTINKVTNYSKFKEVRYSNDIVVSSEGEVIDSFPLPYREFRKELDIRTFDDPVRVLREVRLTNYSSEDIESVKPCFVSRMPSHKNTGAAHKDTIRSGKKEGYTITKTSLCDLKIGKDGEILNYYNREDDRLLYDAIKCRLLEFGGDGKKAFSPDFQFHKPKSDGTPGPVVKKVKIVERSSLNLPVRSGVAANGSMIRIDVFKVEGEGFYFVPIYVSDSVKPTLPNKACVALKCYADWKEMSDNDFLFSLYPNDLVKITAKKDMKMSLIHNDSTLPPEKYGNELMMYYIGSDIATASIALENHDGSYKMRGLGVKTLVNIEKYVVDPIGNISKVNKEKRMYFR